MRDLVHQVVARVVVLLVDRQLLREAERHAARDDRDLVDRIGVRQQHGQQRVAGLVDGGDLLLVVGDDHRAPFGVNRVENVCWKLAFRKKVIIEKLNE